jgi:hypothetical protein
MAIVLTVTDVRGFNISDVNAEHRMDMSTDTVWEESSLGVFLFFSVSRPTI